MSRGGLDHEGIGARFAPWEADDTLKAAVLASGVAFAEGKAVTITGNYKAGFGSAGNALLGKVDKYESDGYMTVQCGGETEMLGVSGSLPTAGNILVVDGAGAVMASTGATGSAKAIDVGTEATGPVMVFIG